MRKAAFVVAALVASAVPALGSAQTRTMTPELRPYVGVALPTGSQRDLFKDAPMLGLQGAFELRPTLHLVGTFGWVPGRHEYVAGQDRVNVYQYDVGAEFGAIRRFTSTEWILEPFVGVGAGARTYDFQSSALPTQTCASGYASLGTELELRDVALRLEGRDNVFCYRSPIAGVSSETRNDVTLSLGVAFHFR